MLVKKITILIHFNQIIIFIIILHILLVYVFVGIVVFIIL